MNCKMRLRTLFAILSVCTLTFAQSETATMHLTLDKAIEIALSDNPTMKVAEKEIKLKEVSKSEAWQNLLPSATLDGAIVYNAKVAAMKVDMGDGVTRELKMGKDDSNTWNGAIQVAIPLYAPAVYKTMSLTKSDLELAVEKARGSKLDLINQVTKAYYQLMLAQDSYQVLLGNYKQAERNYNIVNAKFEQGKVSEFDKISAEVQMTNAWPSVISGQKTIEIAMLQMKVLMGITANINLVIDDNLKNYEGDMSHYSGNIFDLTNNSTLRQIDLQGELLNKQRKIMNTSFQPTLALVGSYQLQSISNTNWNLSKYNWSDAASVTLSLSIPIFKASNFTQLRSNRLQQELLAENRINTERMLGMQAQSYKNNISASVEQLKSNKKAVELAQKGLEISQKMYEVGKGTILELNNSQVSLTNTQLSYNNSIYDYLIARSELQTILGKE